MSVPVNIKNSPAKVQLARIGHVYFEHADLAAFAKFADDFGFVEAGRTEESIYFRGYGKDPFIYVATQSKDSQSRFLGPAFVAQSAADFEKAARVPGAIRKPLVNAPGGGEIITIDRPDNTFLHIVYGQEERQPDPSRAASLTHVSQGPYNTPFEKPRKGTFQRYTLGPALIHKLGHLGYVSSRFDEEVQWYTSNFNFMPTDNLSNPEDPYQDVMTFMHLDLGPDYTDHHTLFIARGAPGAKVSELHHTSYEIADFDEQLMGHHYLAKCGYESIWGVGRHILGSQIFDYWRDTSGFKIEHYADGDMINDEFRTQKSVAGPVSIWAPEMPAEFLKGEVPA